MPSVELIYDASCPNVDAARKQLRQAFQELGQPPAWQEWDREAPSSPAYARQYGSPTILVDGKDVSGASHSDGADCCRVYRSEHGGLQKVPPVESIASALRNSARSKGTGSLRSWLAILPAAGIAMLPKLACPACWPAYAGLLGSIGLGFLMKTVYLLPLTVAFLIVAVGALGFRARNRSWFWAISHRPRRCLDRDRRQVSVRVRSNDVRRHRPVDCGVGLEHMAQAKQGSELSGVSRQDIADDSQLQLSKRRFSRWLINERSKSSVPAAQPVRKRWPWSKRSPARRAT